MISFREFVTEAAMLHDDGTITLFHGTTLDNAKAIVAQGFQHGDPVAIATELEHDFNLPARSILTHPAFQFAAKRVDLDRVHLTASLRIAQSYTTPEAVQDGLAAAYVLVHPEDANKPAKEIRPRKEAWIATQIRQRYTPAILNVRMPFEVVGKHAFGKELTIDDFRNVGLTADDLSSISVPVAALKDAEITIQ